jgi:hypothetical protein
VTAKGEPLDYMTLIGAAGDRLWLSDESGLPVWLDAMDPALNSREQTGLAGDVEVDDVATNGTLTWFATGTGIVEFDGLHWRKLPIPNSKVTGAHGVAVAPDGTLWMIGSVPSSALRNIRYLTPLMIVLPLGLLAATIWFFQRLRGRQLQQHQRVTQAVQHATGEVPVELEIGERRLAWHGTIIWAILIVGSGAGFVLLRKFWPQAPYWTIPVIAIAIHLAITFQQSLVKRKPKASDPIGPGAPS